MHFSRWPICHETHIYLLEAVGLMLPDRTWSQMFDQWNQGNIGFPNPFLFMRPNLDMVSLRFSGQCLNIQLTDKRDGSAGSRFHSVPEKQLCIVLKWDARCSPAQWDFSLTFTVRHSKTVRGVSFRFANCKLSHLRLLVFAHRNSNFILPYDHLRTGIVIIFPLKPLLDFPGFADWKLFTF